MTNLYLVFALVGLLLFAGIVAYSYLQKRQHLVSRDDGHSKGVDERSRLSKKHNDEVVLDQVVNADTIVDKIEQRSVNKEAIDTKPAESKTRKEKATKQPVEEKEYAEQERSLLKKRTDDEQKLEPRLTKRKAKPKVSRTRAEKTKITDDANIVVTELVARMKNRDPVEQQSLLSTFRKHDFKFHRKVHIYGLNELTDMWRDIEFELPSARFLELGVSIQLCDREGAMTTKELHDFQQMVLEFSNDFDAPFEFSMDIDAAFEQAQALDHIGRRYDSMAVLNVVPKTKTGFRIADIESCARDLMMSVDKSGIFLKTEGQKNNITVLYRLACTDGSGQFGIQSGSSTPVYELVLYMNVPITPDPEAVFQELVKDANSLATWLEGKVVDRHGKAMTQRSYSQLMQQISDIAFSMQQDGLVPGDSVAKKLF